MPTKIMCNIVAFLFASFISYSQVNPKNIDIVRDKFGVPHIFGKTDKEAAFGLAWAHSEDNFKTIQETFLPAVSKLGSYKGKEGVVLDYIVQLLRCRNVAENAERKKRVTARIRPRFLPRSECTCSCSTSSLGS